VVGRGVMVGLCEDTPPPTTTRLWRFVAFVVPKYVALELFVLKLLRVEKEFSFILNY